MYGQIVVKEKCRFGLEFEFNKRRPAVAENKVTAANTIIKLLTDKEKEPAPKVEKSRFQINTC